MFASGPCRERGCKFVCYKPLKTSVTWAFSVVRDLSRQLYFYHNLFYFPGHFPYFSFYHLYCFSNACFPPLYNLVYYSTSRLSQALGIRYQIRTTHQIIFPSIFSSHTDITSTFFHTYYFRGLPLWRW